MVHGPRAVSQRWPAVVLALTVWLGGCATSLGTSDGPVPGSTASADSRAVVVTTEGCGYASATRGSGVAVGGDLVLVAAHVVAGSSEVAVDGTPAPVVSLDLGRDLALVRVPGLDAGPVAMADATAGDTGWIVGGVASGTVPYRIVEVVDIDIDAVRSAGRSLRRGYRLEAEIAPGDSGAGMYSASGQLVGVVFGSDPSNDRTTWATAGSELNRFVGKGPSGSFSCNRRESVLEPLGGE